VSEIKSETNKKKRQLFVLKITFPAGTESEEGEEKQDLQHHGANESPHSRKPGSEVRRPVMRRKPEEPPADHKAHWSAAKIGAVAVGAIAVGALTAGMGLVVGMVVLGIGMVGGGGAVAITVRAI
jgi:hypothetical protein